MQVMEVHEIVDRALGYGKGKLNVEQKRTQSFIVHNYKPLKPLVTQPYHSKTLVLNQNNLIEET